MGPESAGRRVRKHVPSPPFAAGFDDTRQLISLPSFFSCFQDARHLIPPPFYVLPLPLSNARGPALRCVLVCAHTKHSQTPGPFCSRSTENGPAFPTIVSRSQEKCPALSAVSTTPVISFHRLSLRFRCLCVMHTQSIRKRQVHFQSLD